MLHVPIRFRRRAINRAIAGTTFCDECGCVRTPQGRREALREDNEQRVRRAILFHH